MKDIGILIIAFSVFYRYKRDEINTFYGFPTWLIGGLFLLLSLMRFIKYYTDEHGRYSHPEATADDIAGQK